MKLTKDTLLLKGPHPLKNVRESALELGDIQRDIVVVGVRPWRTMLISRGEGKTRLLGTTLTRRNLSKYTLSMPSHLLLFRWCMHALMFHGTQVCDIWHKCQLWDNSVRLFSHLHSSRLSFLRGSFLRTYRRQKDSSRVHPRMIECIHEF
jgi:hypothetical protein